MLVTQDIKDVPLLLLYVAWCLVTLVCDGISRGLSVTFREGQVTIGGRIGGAATVTVVCDIKICDQVPLTK